MEVKESYSELIDSDEYREFYESEGGFRLVHAYTEREPGKESRWEFGFYNESRDVMVVFKMDPVGRGPEEAVFKPDGTINPLDMASVSVGYNQALAICESHKEQKYSSHMIAKHIVILQNLHKQVWNITMLTRTFHIINVKIDASSGEIVSSNMNSVMDLGLKRL